MAVDVFPAGVRPITEGGTGATTATTARANLGIPEPYNATTLYSGSITTPLANNTVLTLAENINEFKLLMIQAFAGTPSAGTRMLIIDSPIMGNAHGLVGTTGGGTIGSVYTEHTMGKSWSYINSSFSPFYLATIYGIK